MRKTMLGGLGILALDLFLAISGVFGTTAPSASAAAETAAAVPSCSRSISTTANNDSVAITINRSCTTYYRSVGLWGGGEYDGYHYGTYHGSGWSSVACADKNCDAGNVLWGGYERKSDGKEWCFFRCADAPPNVVGAIVIHLTAFTSGHPPVPVSNAGHLRRTSTFDQQDEQFGDCQRDPSSRGLGTVVVNSSCGTSNAMDWVYQANGHCGGQVTATCPGGHISASQALRGDFIITIKNIGQGSLCEGADAQTNWTMQMFTCDGVGGQNHLNNLFIWSQTAFCGNVSGNDLISYQWNANGLDGTGNVYNPGGTGSNVEVTQVPPACQEALWRLNGS